jgi:hypothetical protein
MPAASNGASTYARGLDGPELKEHPLEEVRLTDLLDGDNDVIEDREFEDCIILGPAVIAPFRCTFEYNVFEGKQDWVLLEVPEGPRIGIIAVRNCVFRRCRFRGIGIAGGQSLIAKFQQLGAGSVQPLRVFYSYAHEDAQLREELKKHLATIRRWGTIEEWYDRDIVPGQAFDGVIAERLEAADIFLPLISSDFIDSDYCFETELQRALEKHKAGALQVVPVIVRPVDWEQTPFRGLLALPKDGKPVTTWANRDEAWLDVAKGIRRVCDSIRGSP